MQLAEIHRGISTFGALFYNVIIIFLDAADKVITALRHARCLTGKKES